MRAFDLFFRAVFLPGVGITALVSLVRELWKTYMERGSGVQW